MAKFRKKPVVVEAEQWLGPESQIPGVEPPEPRSYGDTEAHAYAYYHVLTLEGPLRVSPGDWIITGVCGETYPCKPAIFEATYEPVE